MKKIDTTTAFSLNSDDLKKLQDIAKSKDISLSKLIRRALKAAKLI